MGIGEVSYSGVNIDSVSGFACRVRRDQAVNSIVG